MGVQDEWKEKFEDDPDAIGDTGTVVVPEEGYVGDTIEEAYLSKRRSRGGGSQTVSEPVVVEGGKVISGETSTIEQKRLQEFKRQQEEREEAKKIKDERTRVEELRRKAEEQYSGENRPPVDAAKLKVLGSGRKETKFGKLVEKRRQELLEKSGKEKEFAHYVQFRKEPTEDKEGGAFAVQVSGESKEQKEDKPEEREELIIEKNDRSKQYEDIGKANLENPLMNQSVNVILETGKKGKEFYQKESTQRFLKTSMEVGKIPLGVGVGTFQDVRKTGVYGKTTDYFKNSPVTFLYRVGKTKIGETTIKYFPSSENIKNKFVSESLSDIEIYGTGSDLTSKFRTALASVNIMSSNVLASGYETIRTEPMNVVEVGVIGYGVGGSVSAIAKLLNAKKVIDVGGVILGGTYIAGVISETIKEPQTARGSVIGEELIMGTAFIKGFGKGYKKVATTKKYDLINKEGLSYKGSSTFEQTPRTDKFGIIKEQYSDITKIESSGIITGKPKGRIKSIAGAFTEDVAAKVIYEDRLVRYEGKLFEQDYLIKEKISIEKGTSEISVFELGKEPKKIYEITKSLPPEYVSPIARGFEIEKTRQIKSETPEMGIELYMEKGEIKQRKIQTGKQKESLKRLDIRQERTSGSIEISPNAITEIKTDVSIELRAKQTRPEKTSLYAIDHYEPLSQEVRGIEPFKKTKIGEKSSFRELYFGTEKFESRKAKYDRTLYPKSVEGKLVRQPEFIELPIFEGKGKESLLKEYKIEFEPTDYIGLEKQFTPSKITKQQKVNIKQDFEIYIPTEYERGIINPQLFKEVSRREAEQKAFETFLSGKYTTKESFKELASPRLPIVDNKGRALTPSYLDKLGKKATDFNIKRNEKVWKKEDNILKKEAKKETLITETKAKQLTEKGTAINIKEPKIEEANIESLTKGLTIQTPKIKTEKPIILLTEKQKIINEKIGSSPKEEVISKSIIKTDVKSQNKIVSKSYIKTNVKSNVKTNLKNENKINLKSNLKSELKSELKSQTKTNLFQEQNVNLKQELRQEQKSELLTKTIPSPTDITSRTFIPETPPPEIPKILPPFLGDKEGKKSYSILVRRRGVFKEIGKAPSLKQAFLRGRYAVETTAAASFKVESDDEEVKDLRFLPKNKFRMSKVNPNVYVQKRQFRIGTFGEKREITYKGIAATRQRRARRNTFNIFGG